MYSILAYFLVSILFSIGAFTYTHLLTGPGMILEKLNDWAQLKLPSFLYKPLIGCEKCVAGQWALWGYSLTFNWYDWKGHILFILLNIFITNLITKLYYKIFEPTQKIPSQPQQLLKSK